MQSPGDWEVVPTIRARPLGRDNPSYESTSAHYVEGLAGRDPFDIVGCTVPQLTEPDGLAGVTGMRSWFGRRVPVLHWQGAQFLAVLRVRDFDERLAARGPSQST